MIVLFDAVGTVIKPQPSVIDVYHRLGLKHGSRLSREQVKHRIKLGRRRFFNVGMPAESLFEQANAFSYASELGSSEFSSSDEIERSLWRDLVFEVFADLNSPVALFDELWNHFDNPQNWEVYSDVEACFGVLETLGIEFGLASNFDSRLVSISEQLFPISSCQYVFCSSQVGFRKPSPMFYQQIGDAIKCVSDSTDEPELVMVGNDFENDCIAPQLAGWKSMWLNRQDLEPGSEPGFGAAGKQEVSSLYEFSHWLLQHVEHKD